MLDWQVRHSHPIQRPLSVGEPPRERSLPSAAGWRRDEHPLQPVQGWLEVREPDTPAGGRQHTADRAEWQEVVSNRYLRRQFGDFLQDNFYSCSFDRTFRVIHFFFFLDQGAASSGGGDGSGHRHVLPFPASEGHEELPTTTWGVSRRFSYCPLCSLPPNRQFKPPLTLQSAAVYKTTHCLQPN